MIPKRCRAPRSGGSAQTLRKYLLDLDPSAPLLDLHVVMAEEMSAKVAHAGPGEPIQASQRSELFGVLAESLRREDRGVGTIYEPSTSANGRPTAIFARGVTSLYTAAIEMQSLFDATSHVKSPVAHFIFSLSTEESATVSADQLIRMSMATLDGAGWTGHAAVASVHEDTMKWGANADGERILLDGNKHCHVMVASVNSRTLLAYDRTGENLRLHKSTREQELEFGTKQDWGLYRTRDVGLPTQRIERWSGPDWEARKQEKATERAERQARNFVSDNSGLESNRDRQDRIIHGLRDYLDRCEDRGEKPLMSDVHLIANRLTAAVEGVIDGKLTVRLMERADPGTARKTWIDYFGNERHIAARWQATDTLITLDEKRIARSPMDDWKSKKAPHPMLEVMHERALARRAFLLGLGTEEAAESEYLRVITEDPGRVTRDIVQGRGQATFFVDDLEVELAAHITEGWAEQAERILRDDPTVRIVGNRVRSPNEEPSPLLRDGSAELVPRRNSTTYNGADAHSPIYTTVAQEDMSAKFDRLLRGLLAEKDPLFDRAALDEAIRRVVAREREKNPDFAFTKQQMRAINSFDRRLTVWAGDAGTGKTVLHQVHREMAEITGREIRGFATAQKAADVLAEASGIKSVNQARALVEESRDGSVVMPQDARFVFDEFSMASIESGVALIERAIAANASGVLQLDLSQLPNIAAGNTGGIATRAAADAKALVRLSEVFRQQIGSEVEFMREAVPKGGKAIRTAHRAGFAAYIEEFYDRGIVVEHATRQEEVAAIATDIVDAMRAGQRVIAPGRSYQDCLYVSRHVRAELGLEGTGREFEFDRGIMELAVGDRILFRQNRGREGDKFRVRNGDTGAVTGMAQDTYGRWQIEVALDNGQTVAFNPKRYTKLEYAYASTIHANQGTGAPVVIGSITKGDDARSLHVTMTRAEHILHVHTHLKREDVFQRLTSERSLAAKDDALLFQAVVKRTGGDNSPWAHVVGRAMERADDPLWHRYEAQMAERGKNFKGAIIDILDAKLNPRERDRQLRDAADRYAPQTKVEWAAAEFEDIQAEYDARSRVIDQRDRALTIYHAFSNALDKRTNLGLEQLEIAWRYVWQRERGEAPPMSAESASTLGLETYEELIQMAKLQAAWRNIYLERYGAEPPYDVELAHLSDDARVVDVLQRACQEAGVPVPQRNWNVEREYVANRILAEERERGGEQAMGLTR